MISTAILETMWVWNDYLLPTLVLDIKTFRTDSYGDPVFPRQLRQGGDGTHDGLHHDYGAACYRAVTSICQKYISMVWSPVLSRGKFDTSSRKRIGK